MIQLSEITAWLKVTATTDDTLLTDLEGRAVAFVERITGRYFGLATSTSEIVEGVDQPRLWLENQPHDPTATSIGVTYVVEPGGTTATVTATAESGWQLRKEGNEGYLMRKAGNTWTRRYEYTVVYDKGYDETVGATGTTPISLDAPGEIEQLVLDLIANKYRMRGQENLIAETIDNYSYRLGDFSESDLDAIPWARSTVERWRRINV
jgi:hypothetical protein